MIPNQFKNSQKINHKIRLYIHILPSTDFDWDCLQIDEGKKLLHIRYLFESHSSPSIKTLPKFWKFETDGIFYNCCQSEVYETLRQEILESVSLGADHVLMSYGQNNSGKTFLLSGLHNQFDLRGLVPRFVNDLFIKKETMRNDSSFSVYISAVDVYKNSIFDLLSKPNISCKNLKKIKYVKLKSMTHCFDLLFKAESQRMCCNKSSYNSHLASCIVTFTIKVNSLLSQNTIDKISKVHFVDLAGVETIERNLLTSFKDQQSQGDANLTKTLLEIFALQCQIPKNKMRRDNDFSVNQNVHIITKYLGQSFSPTSTKTFFCHIRPNHEDLMITLSLLKFGMVFKCISTEITEMSLGYNNTERKTEPIEDEVKLFGENSGIEIFQKENCQMEISQSRIDFVRRLVKLFLKGEVKEFELMSMVNDYSLILTLMKSIITETPSTAHVATQIDLEEERISFIHEKLSLISEPSMINNKEALIKEVSFKKTKETKEDTLMKGKKHPQIKNEEEKLQLKSEAVQVNLIEPYLKMPTIDSRENHWATFLIAMPNIQAILDNLTLSVKEKEKTLNDSKLKYKEIQENLIKTQLQLKALKSVQFIESTDKSSSTCNSLEKEKDLIIEFNLLEKQLETSKQLMINSEIEWLDALYNMIETKQKIDYEFNQFCSTNSSVVLENEVLSEEEPKQSIKIQIPAEVKFNYLKNIYNNLQRKYLNQHQKNR